MDDFLHNLRTGKNKPYDRKRRTYDNPNRNFDRQGNRSRRPFNQNKDLSNETLTAIRKVLDEISVNQKKLADISNRRVAVEERKAEALESLVSYLQNRPEPVAVVPETPTVAAAFTPETAVANEPATPAEVETQVLNRREIIALIKKHRQTGLSYEKVALKLEEEGVQTLSGRGRWRGQTIYRLAQEG